MKTVWVFVTRDGVSYEVPGDSPTFEDACVNAAAAVGVSIEIFNAVFLPYINRNQSFDSVVDG